MEEENKVIKEKKKIQISLGLAISLIIIFLLIIAGVIIGAVLIIENNKVDEKEQIIQEDEKGFVYTALEEKCEAYSYSIPKINIDSEYVEYINEEIEENLIKIAKEEIDEVNKYKKEHEDKQEDVGYGCEPCNISYEYYINDDIISLVIKKGYSYDYIEYYTYNINKKTGEKYTNEEILNYKGISINDFENKLLVIYKKYFEYRYKNSMDEEGYNEQYNATIAKENCNVNQPIILDGNGDINVVAKIYSLAGAQYYYHIINLEDEVAEDTYVVCSESNVFIFLDSGNAYYKKDVIINSEEEVEIYKTVDDNAIKIETEDKVKAIKGYQLGTDVLTTIFLILENGKVLSTSDYDIEGNIEADMYYFKDYEVEDIIVAKQIESEYDYPVWGFETLLKNGETVLLESIETSKNTSKIEFYVKDSYLYVNIQYEKEFEKIEYLINGETFVDYPESANVYKENKEVKRKKALISGENHVEVTIYYKDGTIETRKGMYNHNV